MVFKFRKLHIKFFLKERIQVSYIYMIQITRSTVDIRELRFSILTNERKHSVRTKKSGFLKSSSFMYDTQKFEQ